jgi:hypothetical protein
MLSAMRVEDKSDDSHRHGGEACGKPAVNRAKPAPVLAPDKVPTKKADF